MNSENKNLVTLDLWPVTDALTRQQIDDSRNKSLLIRPDMPADANMHAFADGRRGFSKIIYAW